MVIADAPDYSANPAHLAEQVAIPIVRQWVGSHGTLHDDSATNAAFDFTINYTDGRSAVGDVWLDADQTLSAVWGDLFKQDVHHVIPLSAGAGTWSLGLTHEARGKALRLGLPSLVDACLELGWTDIEFEHGWVAPEAPAPMRAAYVQGHALGIAYLTRHDAEGSSLNDAAFYFPQSDPKAQATDPTTVAGWITQVFASPAGVKHIEKKLVPAKADERHAFVVAHTGTPSTIQARLATLSDTEPGLNVPSGITHVWVLPRHIEPSVGPIAGLWTQTDDWRVISC